jgi:hypothetical protein
LSTQSKDGAKRIIQELVVSYQQVVSKGKKDQFSEADVGSKFILPFLEALGWDIKNIDEVKEQKRTLTGPVDYSLSLFGKPKLVVEIKRFDEHLDGYRVVRGVQESFPEQAIRYAWHLKLDWVVLSNFEETRLYYSHVRNAEDGLVFSFRFNEYLDDANFSKLWVLSKESISLGELDRYERRRVRRDVDEEILKDLIEGRQMLVSNVRRINPTLSIDQVNESTQKILNRLIFIRSCEDRLIIPGESLWTQFETWQKTAIDKSVRTLMMDLRNMFRDFDAVYNGKLFEPHVCEDLKIDNGLLEELVKRLYKYNFDWIPVDVLGNAYELYIGTIIKEKQGALKPEEEVTLVEDPAIRKKHGIYYTPTPIVDFIVQHTLGELLRKCETPNQVSKVKVIDPACGSGSFLIRAFDYLHEWHSRYNRKIQESSDLPMLDKLIGNDLVDAVKKRILLDNLYGVDLDPQAVDIVILNLGLKSIERGEGLPYINDHVRCGNSLIGAFGSTLGEVAREKLEEIQRVREAVKDLELKMSFDKDTHERTRYRRERDGLIAEQETLKARLTEDLNERIGKLVAFEEIGAKHPLHWIVEFPEVFQEGGFDVVIANPPYYNLQTINDEREKEWLRKAFPDIFTGESDIHYFFYARGVQMLKEGGLLGFISSRYFMEAAHAEPFRRFIQDHVKIKLILDFGSVVKVFKDATINTVVTILEKCSNQGEREKNQIKVVKVADWKRDIDSLMEHVAAHLGERDYSDPFISVFEFSQYELDPSIWVVTPKTAEEVITKVQATGVPLSDLCEIFKSLESGLDQVSKDHMQMATEKRMYFSPPLEKGEEVFRVSEETLRKKGLERQVCKPLLKNQDVRRYLIDWKGDYLLFLTDDSDINQYPNVHRHLSRYRQLLEARYDIKNRGAPWYSISNPRNLDKITAHKDRLVTPYISPENRFALVRASEDWIYSGDVYVVLSKEKCPVDLKFILGILNSKLFEFIHKLRAKAVDGAAMTSKGQPGRRFSYQTKYLSQHPIAIPKNKEQKRLHDEIVNLVDTMIELRRRWNKIDVVFDHYMTEPVVESQPFKRYYDELKLEEIKISDNSSSGQIRKIKVEEDGEWLVFKVDYSVTESGERKPVDDHEVVRCKFSDEVLRKFLYAVIANYKGKIGSGNLLSKILYLQIPIFSENVKENRRIIEKIMEAFLKAVKEKTALEDKIREIDREIDLRVYRLYDLQPAEIALVEGSYTDKFPTNGSTEQAG